MKRTFRKKSLVIKASLGDREDSLSARAASSKQKRTAAEPMSQDAMARDLGAADVNEAGFSHQEATGRAARHPRRREGLGVVRTPATQKKRPTQKGDGIARPRQSTARALRSLDSSALLPAVEAEAETLAANLGQMIELARQQVAHTANMALTTLYWQLGVRVRTEVLEGTRAAYGAQIVSALGRQLEARHGRGFGEKSPEAYGPFRRGLPGCRDWLRAAETIVVEPFQAAHLIKKSGTKIAGHSSCSPTHLIS